MLIYSLCFTFRSFKFHYNTSCDITHLLQWTPLFSHHRFTVAYTLYISIVVLPILNWISLLLFNFFTKKKDKYIIKKENLQLLLVVMKCQQLCSWLVCWGSTSLWVTGGGRGKDCDASALAGEYGCSTGLGGFGISYNNSLHQISAAALSLNVLIHHKRKER